MREIDQVTEIMNWLDVPLRALLLLAIGVVLKVLYQEYKRTREEEQHLLEVEMAYGTNCEKCGALISGKSQLECWQQYSTHQALKHQ